MRHGRGASTQEPGVQRSKRLIGVWCQLPGLALVMVCPTAKILFEKYANAAMEEFEAADALATLVGQHGQFEEAKRHAEQAHEKCSAAHMALDKHWMEHSCREGIGNGS